MTNNDAPFIPSTDLHPLLLTIADFANTLANPNDSFDDIDSAIAELDDTLLDSTDDPRIIAAIRELIDAIADSESSN